MDSWISRNVLQGLQDVNYISCTMQFFIWSNQYVIFANQVSDLLIFSPISVDLASVYVMCPKIPRHPSKLHLLNNIKNMTEVSQLWFKWSSTNSCLNNITLFNYPRYFANNIIFSTELPLENGDNSYQLLDGSDTWTKSGKFKIRVSKSEAWLANMPVCMCLKNYMLEQWKSWSVSEYLYFFNWFVFVWHLTESPTNSLKIL